MAKRRFSPAQLRAQRDFARRFGGKKSRRVATPRKSKTVAKKSSRKTSRRSRARAALSGLRSRVQLKRSILPGAAVPPATAALQMVGLGEHAPAVAMGAVGVVTGNETLQTMAGLRASAVLLDRVTAGTGVATGQARYI